MYKKILVPLDGSKLGECVLPHVETIAKGCGVQIVDFIRVVEPIYLPATTDGADVLNAENWKQVQSKARKEAERYMTELSSQIKYNGVNVFANVLDGGKAADVIADYATKGAFDLIVISTHGRSGVSRWVWGSVADRILRSSCVPVLMVRAPGCVAGV